MHNKYIFIPIMLLGAHMNPAVTLAFAVTRRLAWKKVPVYWAAQIVGSFVASACVYGVYYGKSTTTKMVQGTPNWCIN